MTTPEAAELQALLAVMRDGGADAVVMEVSSHALALGRVDAIRFDVAAFTNFGRTTSTSTATWRPTSRPRHRCSPADRTDSAVINVDDDPR